MSNNAEFVGFHKFRAGNGTEFGSFEVFLDEGDPLVTPGYYWWPCHERCMPEDEQTGPFPTAEGAYLDALEGAKEPVQGYNGPEMGIFDDYEGMDSGINTTPDVAPGDLVGINFLDELSNVMEGPDGVEIMRHVNEMINNRQIGNYQLPVDTALEEGCRYERTFGDGNDVGG